MFRLSLLLTLTVACQNADVLVPSEGGHPDGDEAKERAGSNCYTCHSQFTAAGTVHTKTVAKIELVDSEGARAVMYPNPYGNFFRHTPLEPPFDVRVTMKDGSVRAMKNAPHGSCNACHHELLNGAGKL
jgi:hypothetical protein